MGCTKCKEKKEIIKTQSKFGDKSVTWIVIVWFFLGLYGLYSLFVKLL